MTGRERESSAYFRALAVDFDGTLARDGHVSADTLAAIDEARAALVTVVLVTGRILAGLYRVFPDAGAHVDAIVAENGAVVSTRRGARLVASPVDPSVGEALNAAGVAWRSGQVLLACSGADEPAVLDVIRRLGLEYQLVRNRGELMVLPPGITKGTGLLDALGELGLSPHNTVGVGDAENDHSLLAVCELGAAVSDAVEALRAHADLVLEHPDGAGVAELLRSGVFAGHERVFPRRWQLTLGADADGRPVTVPASQLNLVVAGGTGDGKSYLAGLMAEQLVGLGYSVFVVDPEGDHIGLAQLRDVLVVDARRGVGPAEVVRLLHHRYATIVLDLSGLSAEDQHEYVGRLSVEIEAYRRITGLPQWVVVDEAHGPLGREAVGTRMFEPAAKGYLLVTWHPEELSADVVAGVDAVVALGSPRPSEGLVDVTAAVADLPRADIARLLVGPPGRAVLVWRHHPGRATAFALGGRATPHLRHQHKYGVAGVDEPRRFYFRAGPDAPTGAVAANLGELEAELSRCDRAVLCHHCPKLDFSRWIEGVFHDRDLAEQVEATEGAVTPTSPDAVVEEARVALVAALQQRRLARDPPS